RRHRGIPRPRRPGGRPGGGQGRRGHRAVARHGGGRRRRVDRGDRGREQVVGSSRGAMLMKVTRRPAVLVALGVALALVTACGGQGDGGGGAKLKNYPNRNIEVGAAGEPGGGVDIFSRASQQSLKEEELFTKSMTITNRGGGGGNTAMAALQKKRGDA